MANSNFGQQFRITTWGESHGSALGCVIDGCPAQLPISKEEIDLELAKRAPGKSRFVSPRKEEDKVDILSGIFEGKTTGAPIALLIYNQDAKPSDYAPLKDLHRPSHAGFAYLEKYGIYDQRGGGRASGRETVARVAAGAVAKKLLLHFGIEIVSYMKQIGSEVLFPPTSFIECKRIVEKSPLFCVEGEERALAVLEKVFSENDSCGGVVEFRAVGLPAGLGDPVFEKLPANLAKGLMSIPAAKGFEIGEGFYAASMSGSSHNDPFILEDEKIVTETNHSGGTLGGISNGMPLIGRVAFKPPSSIKQQQKTVTVSKEPVLFTLPESARHDPCLAIRAAAVVEAMVALVLADALLINRSSKL